MSRAEWPHVKHVQRTISETTGKVTTPEQRILVIPKKICDWLTGVWEKPKSATIHVENRDGRVWLIAQSGFSVRAVSTYAGELPAHAQLPIGRIAWELKYGGETAYGLHFDIETAKTRNVTLSEKETPLRDIDLADRWWLDDAMRVSDVWGMLPEQVSFGRGFLPQGINADDLAAIGKIEGGSVFFGPGASETAMFAVCGDDGAPLSEQRWFALLPQRRKKDPQLPGLDDGDESDVDRAIDETFRQPGFAAELRAAGARVERNGDDFKIFAGDGAAHIPDDPELERAAEESPADDDAEASSSAGEPYRDPLAVEVRLYVAGRGFFHIADVQRKFGLEHERTGAIRDELMARGDIGPLDVQSGTHDSLRTLVNPVGPEELLQPETGAEGD